MTKKCLLVIKPEAIKCRQEVAIKNALVRSGMTLEREKRVRFNEFQAKVLLRKHRDKKYFEHLKELIKSSFCVVFTVYSKDGDIFEELKSLIGDFDPRIAKEGTIRREFLSNECLFEDTPIYNTVLFSEDEEESERFFNLIYGEEEK